MANENLFAVINVDTLVWPHVSIPSPRFRLFVAADTARIAKDPISRFSNDCLSAGMVYLCAWGRGCERLHDIVDEAAARHKLFGENRLADATPNDVVMTTWHADESLGDALDFFVTCAVPADGYGTGNCYRVVVCVGHPEWATAARNFLKAAPFRIALEKTAGLSDRLTSL